MAITFVSSVSAALGPGGGTTGAFTTTGADCLVVCVASGTAPGVTDSKGNTYVALTTYGSSSVKQRLFYTLAPTVGTGHTLTVTGSYVSVVAYAFAGVSAYDGQQNGSDVTSTGSVTPSVHGALLVTGMGSNQATADTVPAGFTGPVTIAFGGGNNYQESAAYLVQATAAAINPTWAVSPAKLLATSVAVFRPPTTVAVPTVVGALQADASTAITAAGLTVGTITTATSGSVAAGYVISQSPTAGTVVALGTAVAFVVSTGPPTVAVPDVVDDLQADAVTALEAAGLTVTVSLAVSGSVAAGHVISQSPTAGTVVTVGTAVAIVVAVAAVVPAPVASVQAALGINGGTTGAFTTTGATLLVASVASHHTGAIAVSDSKGNVYTALPSYLYPVSVRQQLFYVLGPVVGSGHTVTVSGTGVYASVVVYAFNGVTSYTGDESGSATTACGPVTPTADGSLLVTGMASNQATPDTAPAGCTGLITNAFVTGASYQSSAAFLVQSPAATIDPTWAVSPAKALATAVAVFGPAAAPTPPTPGLVVTIDGVPQRILHESLSIQATVNGRDRLSATLPLPTVAPEVRQEIVVTHDGVRIFAGFLDTATMRAGSSWTDRDDQLLYDVTAVDYNVLADWRLVNGPRPEETIKAYLTDLVLFLAGVTLDPVQVDGPLLPSRGQTFQTISQVLDEASTITGYVWNIDYEGRLKMWLPSVEPAPFDILDSNDSAIGDITVEPSTTGYANMVWVLAGDSGQHDISSTFTGDGTTLTWNLPHGLVTHGGTLTHAGVTENVGPGEAWELDALPTPYAFTLRRAIGGAPAVGALIVFPYTAQYPLVFRAEDSAAIAAVGFIVEQVFQEPTVFDPAQGQALVDGYLAQLIQDVREVRYTTLRGDMLPGQTQTITIATRGLSGSFVISDVETRMQDPVLIRHVTARNPGPYAGNWRDVYKLWAQGQTSAAAYAGTSSAPPAVVSSATSAAYFLGASAVEWQRVAAPVDWVPAGGVQVQPQGMTSGTVTARLRALSGTVTARLQDVTASTTAGTSSVVASPTFQPVTFAVGLTAGHTYELQLLPSLPAVDVQGIGFLW